MNDWEGLQKLAEELAADGLETIKYDEKAVCVQLRKGKSFQVTLLSGPDFIIKNVAIKKGSVYPHHKHKYYQVIIIYRGKLKVLVSTSKQKSTLGAHSVLYIRPGEAHCCEALEDTRGLLVSMPGVVA